jgi:Mce-associated membrane protein
VISDARARPPVEDEDVSTTQGHEPDDTTAEGAAEDTTEPTRTRRRKQARAAKAATAASEAAEDSGRRTSRDDEPGRDGEATPRRGRPSLPLVPVLGVLLVLLLGAAGFLWFTRTEPSAVTTDDYVEVLQAARSKVVDFPSFDYLTLDDDIEQVRRVSVGDLRDGAVEQLDSRRQEITDAEAVVSTEVIGAGVTRADSENATVVMVIQTTRETNASEQAQVVKYRIEVEMQHADGRWVLSKITGA